MQYIYKAFVKSIYDADTITVKIDLGFGISMDNVKIRLLGINAPEMRGSEKAKGTISRDALRDMIFHKEIILETHRDKTGKYGRYLGTIYFDDININDWLVSEGYAKYHKY